VTKYEYTDKAMELAVSCKTFAENTCQRWRDEVPYGIDAITNGVHAPTWVSEPFQELFDRYIPGWRKDSFMLRYALNISREDVWNAHQRARRLLLDRVNRETNAGMKEDVLTLGFARRATAYKRADLLVHDIGRLKDIAARTRG
jgi:glycogen phosphorylase